MRSSHRVVTVAIATTIVSVLTWGNVCAQPSFELGIKAGLGLTKLVGDDTESTEPGIVDLGDGFYGVGDVNQTVDELKVGFVGGAYASLHFNHQFAIRLEGLYVRKGGKGKNGGPINVYDESENFVGTAPVDGDNSVRLDYVELPLLAVVSFPMSATGTFDLFAGPALSFKAKAEIEQTFAVSANGGPHSSTEKIDIGDEIDGTDFGGVLGAGVTFGLPKVVVFAEARWTYGFTKIDKAEDSDIKNNTFGFMVGVGIPIVTGP